MPDISLKSLFPDLAKQLEMTEGALYERMRALQRAGLIKAIPGKGPGKGVRATPRSMAVLLIGLLVTESLVETIPLTRLVIALKNKHGEKFVDALEAFLASPPKAERVLGISIMRARNKLARATIYFYDETGDVEEEFGATEREIYDRPYGTQTGVNIRLGDIAKELK